MLTNIVGNAIKFTEHGQVELRVSADSPGRVLFSVSDTGIGIAPDRLQAIFDPFVQADASMSRRFGGTGLGTTISKQLVELMGGWIRARSEEGKGSCFEFSLPLAIGKKPAPAPDRKSRVTLPPLSILAVDDIPQNLDLLDVLLGQAGHRVVRAIDGLEAVAQVQQQRFDVILMDMQMPRLDGFGATQQIHAWQQRQGQARTPIVALTASVLEEDKLAARAAGMDGFATKPVDLDMLNREIARVLGIEVSPLPPRPLRQSGELMLDWEQGAARWGDLHTYIQELTRFAIQYGRLALDLDSLVQQQDFASLAAEAHAARGVAANLAITGLLQPLTALEQAASAQQPDACTNAISSLARCLPHFGAELALLLRQQAPAGKDDKDGKDDNDKDHVKTADLANVKAALQRLQHAAANNQWDDEALLALQQHHPQSHADQVERIVEAFNDFEFTAALPILEQLLQELE